VQGAMRAAAPSKYSSSHSSASSSSDRPRLQRSAASSPHLATGRAPAPAPWSARPTAPPGPLLLHRASDRRRGSTLPHQSPSGAPPAPPPSPTSRQSSNTQVLASKQQHARMSAYVHKLRLPRHAVRATPPRAGHLRLRGDPCILRLGGFCPPSPAATHLVRLRHRRASPRRGPTSASPRGQLRPALVRLPRSSSGHASGWQR
jgi:hypothetical protein